MIEALEDTSLLSSASDSRSLTSMTVVEALVRQLAALGVEQAFGINGGAIAVLFDQLHSSPIDVHHFRHENGAAYAAEAYFASGCPTMVFVTTGPGLFNVLSGMRAAKWDGAKIVLVSGATGSALKGRWATQETSSFTVPTDALYTAGTLFDFAIRMEDVTEMPEILHRLRAGLAGQGGFIAHLGLPMSLLTRRLDLPAQPAEMVRLRMAPSVENVESCAALLHEGPFAVWVGGGARGAAPWVRAFVERTGARVFCSPRGKGIVSEEHPLFVGVTGVGGHESVAEYMLQEQPRRVLVLGTRLGEATSLWDPDLVPAEGFIHVDLDPEVPGVAYPETPTVGLQADIGCFLEALLPHFPEHDARVVTLHRNPPPAVIALRDSGLVRPPILMQAIQNRIVRHSGALVMSECGSCLAWCSHSLRFTTPGRFRVSPHFGCLGHFAAGVVGAALACRDKAVAVVCDQSMLTTSEVNTAVQYGAPAVWIVLHDRSPRLRPRHPRYIVSASYPSSPHVDFVQMACSMGAAGARVDREPQIEPALDEAMSSALPFVVDVHIDPDVPSPLEESLFESLS